MKTNNLFASSFVVEEEKIWFVPVRYNYLCCYNLETSDLEKRILLPEPNYYIRMFDNIHSVGDLLYLIPFNGEDILVYDKKNHNFKKISMAPYNNNRLKFYASCIYKGKLFLFPQRVRAEEENPFIVIKIDLERKEELKAEPLKLSTRPQEKDCREIFGVESYIEENRIYLLFLKSNKLLEYNLENGEYRIVEIGNFQNEYSSMYKEENIFYFINQNGDVIVWDKQNDNIFQYENKINGFEIEKKKFGYEFYSSVRYENYIYFFPMFANKVICFDKDKKKISEAFFNKKIVGKFLKKDFPDILGKFSKVICKETCFYIWNLYNHIFYKIDLITKTIKEWNVETTFNLDELKILYNEFGEKKNWLYCEQKTAYVNLEFFLQQVLSKSYKGDNERSYIGEKIYKVTME